MKFELLRLFNFGKITSYFTICLRHFTEQCLYTDHVVCIMNNHTICDIKFMCTLI